MAIDKKRAGRAFDKHWRRKEIIAAENANPPRIYTEPATFREIELDVAGAPEFESDQDELLELQTTREKQEEQVNLKIAGWIAQLRSAGLPLPDRIKHLYQITQAVGLTECADDLKALEGWFADHRGWLEAKIAANSAAALRSDAVPSPENNEGSAHESENAKIPWPESGDDRDLLVELENEGTKPEIERRSIRQIVREFFDGTGEKPQTAITRLKRKYREKYDEVTAWNKKAVAEREKRDGAHI